MNPVAEGIHGITPADLEAGLDRRAALGATNDRVRGGVAYCDGGGFDEHFLHRLADAGDFEPTFALAGLRELAETLRLSDDLAMRAAGLADETSAPAEHRAGPDALRLALAFARATGRDPTVVAMG